VAGLKDRDDVPKTGWRRVGEVEDLGALTGTCEWDENRIRYVQVMHHPQWGSARVRRVCAANMMGDPWSLASHPPRRKGHVPATYPERDRVAWDDDSEAWRLEDMTAHRDSISELLLRAWDLTLSPSQAACMGVAILLVLYLFDPFHWWHI
jgi:hypothetical protein